MRKEGERGKMDFNKIFSKKRKLFLKREMLKKRKKKGKKEKLKNEKNAGTLKNLVLKRHGLQSTLDKRTKQER